MFACLHAPGNAALLLECAKHFSPLIEETSRDTVVFDIRGLRLIFGGPDRIAAEIQRRAGLPARLAIAANPDAAMHAALGIAGVTILPPGGEAPVLAPLPLYLLGGSPDFVRTLNLWGIRTFGEFAALPPLGVAARLGAEGSHLQRLAQGAGSRQLRLRVEPPLFRVSRELEESVRLLEPLLLHISQLLDELCEQLRCYGWSTNKVHLCLDLERTPSHAVELNLPVPALDPKMLLDLLQLELSSRPPRARVRKIHLELTPVEPRATQYGLFLPPAPEPQKLEVTLARIRGLVGAANVGAPEMIDTHRPGAVAMGPLQASSATAVPVRPKLAFRRCRPPCPAQVWCAGGKPVRIASSMCAGMIVAAAGPWRTSGDWWSDDGWDRWEWDVEIQSAGVSRIFHDDPRNQWFIEGNYD